MLIIFKGISARGLQPGRIQPHHYCPVQVGALKGRHVVWPHSVNVCVIVLMWYMFLYSHTLVQCTPYTIILICPRWKLSGLSDTLYDTQV